MVLKIRALNARKGGIENRKPASAFGDGLISGGDVEPHFDNVLPPPSRRLLLRILVESLKLSKVGHSHIQRCPQLSIRFFIWSLPARVSEIACSLFNAPPLHGLARASVA